MHAIRKVKYHSGQCLPPQTLLIWFRFIIPAQSLKERVELLSGFKKMAPASFFNEGMEVIKQALTGKEFDELNKALG